MQSLRPGRPHDSGSRGRGCARAFGSRMRPTVLQPWRGLSFTKRLVNTDTCARASPSGPLSCHTLSPSLEPCLLCAGSQPRDHSHKTTGRLRLPPRRSHSTEAGLQQTRLMLSATPHAHGTSGLNRSPEMRSPAPYFKIIIKVSSVVQKV